jgi:hypothetical protein
MDPLQSPRNVPILQMHSYWRWYHLEHDSLPELLHKRNLQDCTVELKPKFVHMRHIGILPSLEHHILGNIFGFDLLYLDSCTIHVMQVLGA